MDIKVLEEEVIALLKDKEKITPSEIYAITGTNFYILKMQLDELQKKGIIASQRKGKFTYYVLPKSRSKK